MPNQLDPPWLAAARRDIGLRETAGAGTSARIAAWLKNLRAWWADDETPWCGTACAAWMREAGVNPPASWFRARAWADWGEPCTGPLLGSVVVFARTGGGHVGIVAGTDTAGRVLVLGGNQGDAVCIAPFDQARVLAYRWPPGVPRPITAPPVFAAAGPSSRREA